MHITRPLAGFATGIVIAIAIQSGVVGSTPPPLPDGITTRQADVIVDDALAEAAGTPAAASLRDGVSAAEHRGAVDDTLSCLRRNARAIGIDVTIRGPHASADGARWDYTYGAARSPRSAELPGLEQACRARHLEQIERARLAELGSRSEVLRAGREQFDSCLAAAGLTEHLDASVPAPEVARRATASGGPADDVIACAAAHPLLFTAHHAEPTPSSRVAP